MSSHAIEIILTRQLAETLAMPVFLVDPQGTLVFYNEPAERILGRRFEETGAMPAEVWGTAFAPQGADGEPIPTESLPLSRALTTRRPAHAEFRITGLDGTPRTLRVTAFPLVGQGARLHGAVAMFWEVDR